MIERPTTLVLGAGASQPYQFPLGAKLRRDILNVGSNPHLLRSSELGNHWQLAEFLEAFRQSRLYSIDSFLTARPEMAEVGKLAIAAVLLEYETTYASYLTADEQNWYDYLWNQLANGHSWEELSFDNLSIVTFNYDRSLEHFLLTAMMGTYKQTLGDAAKKLKQLKIVHVYGDIGAASPLEDGYEAYARPIVPARVARGATRLKVIPEARVDEPTLLEAQRLLRKAKAICFLGFGFDRTNLARLKAIETCRVDMPMANGATELRAIAASCLGLTKAELEAAGNACGIRIDPFNSRYFVDGDCMTTLRETLILG